MATKKKTTKKKATTTKSAAKGKDTKTSGGGASGGKRAKKRLSAAERKERHSAKTAGAGDGKKAKAATKEKTPAKPKRLSLIDAAAQVLGGSKESMNCKQMVEQVMTKKLWSPRQGGKTPHATLYSAILREIQKKGKDARFAKVDRGQFTLSAPGKKGG